VAAAVTLVTATPVMLAAVALVTGTDRPERRIWMALSLSAVGMLMIGGWDFGRSSDALAGDLLALLGAAAMAAYLLVVRRLGPSLDAFAFSGVATTVGGVSLLATAAGLGLPIEAASDEALVYLVLAALLPQIVGHGLLTWAVRLATPVAVAVATVGEPVGATLLGWLWLGEALTMPIAVGCAVTLAGVLLAAWQPASETV
jgi:drug/metabolite transporter (DMT)-like permease